MHGVFRTKEIAVAVWDNQGLEGIGGGLGDSTASGIFCAFTSLCYSGYFLNNSLS